MTNLEKISKRIGNGRTGKKEKGKKAKRKQAVIRLLARIVL